MGLAKIPRWRPLLSHLVEFRHRYGLGARPARSTLDGVLDDQPLGPPPGLGAVHLEQVRPEPRVVLAQPAPAEPAGSPRGLCTEPTKHYLLLTDDYAGSDGDRPTGER